MRKKLFIIISSLLLILLNFSSVAAQNVSPLDNDRVKSLVEGEDCTTCESGSGKEKPESKGSEEEQQKSLDVVLNSTEHQNNEDELSQNDGTLELEGISVVEGTTQAVVVYGVEDPTNGLTVLTYWVDFTTNELIEEKIYTNEVIPGEQVNIYWTLNGQEKMDVNINSNGLVITDQGEMTLDEYFVTYEDEIKEKTEDAIGTNSLCSWAVGLLCVTGTSYGCYLLCAAGAVVNVLGGAACAVACGIIFGGGSCIAADNAVCG